MYTRVNMTLSHCAVESMRMVSLKMTRSEIGGLALGAHLGEDLMAQVARDIAFDKPLLSQSNVWGAKTGVSVEELAEDIVRRGLLQGLGVLLVWDADSVDTGKFEIPADGRGFQSLSLLMKQKRPAKTAPLPCMLRDVSSDILTEDDSLAENMKRLAFHPLNQREEAISASFFVTPQIVKQRLKLASMAPALLVVYAEDGMTLVQLMAFTVNPDHVCQVQVWEAVKNLWNKEPYLIRRILTETSVRASDRRAVFVGIDAYEAAGGVAPRDLFQGMIAVCWTTLPCSSVWSRTSCKPRRRQLLLRVEN